MKQITKIALMFGLMFLGLVGNSSAQVAQEDFDAMVIKVAELESKLASGTGTATLDSASTVNLIKALDSRYMWMPSVGGRSVANTMLARMDSQELREAAGYSIVLRSTGMPDSSANSLAVQLVSGAIPMDSLDTILAAARNRDAQNMSNLNVRITGVENAQATLRSDISVVATVANAAHEMASTALEQSRQIADSFLAKKGKDRERQLAEIQRKCAEIQAKYAPAATATR